MSVRLSTRATSLSAAALLLGAAVIAAFSIRVVIDGDTLLPQTPIFETLRPEPPKPPPQAPKQARPPTPVKEFVTPTDPPISNPEAPPIYTPIPVASPPADPGPIVITRPDWVRRPTNLEIYYPGRARERGVEGVAQLDCLVQVDGRLNCTVVSETPAGWQFGNAALRMARDHRMVPATRDGLPVEAKYRMRVPFNLDER